MTPMHIFEEYTFSPNEEGPAIVSSPVPLHASGVIRKTPGYYLQLARFTEQSDTDELEW